MTAPDPLDDPGGLQAGDPGEMLRAVATSAAQVREAVTLAADAGLAGLREYGRPRALVVAGMGGSGIAGDVVAAVAGDGCPVPVLTHRGYGLPAWVGAADLVVAVSSSGATEETLSATDEALRRGCRLMGVGASGSPLAERIDGVHAPFVGVPARGRQPRACLWALATPVLLAAAELELTPVPAGALEATAARLEEVAAACRADSDAFVNPAKNLALTLAGTLPVVWGAGPLAAVAAYRLHCQLAENAKHPSMWGALPEATHNQVVTFDGMHTGAQRDIFADPGDEAEPARLHLVLLRDPAGEPAPLAARADAAAELAEARGVGVTVLRAEGSHPLERLASLVAPTDFASVYLALAQQLDPTPVQAISELKARLR